MLWILINIFIYAIKKSRNTEEVRQQTILSGIGTSSCAGSLNSALTNTYTHPNIYAFVCMNSFRFACGIRYMYLCMYVCRVASAQRAHIRAISFAWGISLNSCYKNSYQGTATHFVIPFNRQILGSNNMASVVWGVSRATCVATCVRVL